MFECCPVCYWEDDGQDDEDADVVRGGPNASLSLSEARENYRRYGACEERFRRNVRRPSQRTVEHAYIGKIGKHNEQ